MNKLILSIGFSCSFVLLGIVSRVNAGDCDCQTSGDGDPNAKFVSMTITLCTDGDDKDGDTRLEIWINKEGEHEAAYRDLGRSEYFPNNSTKVFDVPKKSNEMTRSEIPGSWVQLRIAPNGHDTWRFSLKAVLNFTDGTTYTKCFNNLALDQAVVTGIYHL